MLSYTKKKNIPSSFLYTYKIYVARINNVNKTEQSISGWLNANCIDRMTVFIFHPVTIKSTFCDISHKDRYYNNAVPLFLCSHELIVITGMHLLLLVLSRRGVHPASGRESQTFWSRFRKDDFFPVWRPLDSTEQKSQNWRICFAQRIETFFFVWLNDYGWSWDIWSPYVGNKKCIPNFSRHISLEGARE
jgi:hypothetical protein